MALQPITIAMKLITGNIFLITLILIISHQLSMVNCCYAQQKKLNQKVYDEQSKSEIMIGYCTLDGISDTAFITDYIKGYDEFQPQKKLVNQMYSLLDSITVTIVMGTWCSDSKEQVPRFMRLFDELEHSFATPTFICVDRNKKAGDVSMAGMNILNIPTFIVYYKGRELGRIVEAPKTTIDQDFLEILKK